MFTRIAKIERMAVLSVDKIQSKVRHLYSDPAVPLLGREMTTGAQNDMYRVININSPQMEITKCSSREYIQYSHSLECCFIIKRN